MAALRTPLLLLLVAALALAETRFKACKRNQAKPEFDECVRDALQKAVPELVKGLPEFGLHTIDPLRVEKVQVPRSGKGAVNIDLTFKNLDIIGLQNAKIKSLEMDVDNYKMMCNIDIDSPVYLQGEYTVSGKVLVLPIEGSGRCNITLVNAKVAITELLAKPLTKDGKDYAQVTSLKFVVKDVDKVHYDLQNLFNGNKELGENMNLVLNDNWKQIFEDLRAPVQSALGAELRSIVDNIVKSVPYDHIFPKS